MSGIQMVKSHDLTYQTLRTHQAFFIPVFRPPFKYQAIWQPDTNLPFEYQTGIQMVKSCPITQCPLFKWWSEEPNFHLNIGYLNTGQVKVRYSDVFVIQIPTVVQYSDSYCTQIPIVSRIACLDH